MAGKIGKPKFSTARPSHLCTIIRLIRRWIFFSPYKSLTVLADVLLCFPPVVTFESIFSLEATLHGLLLILLPVPKNWFSFAAGFLDREGDLVIVE